MIRAAVVEIPGPASSIEVEWRQEPRPKPHEVLVAVAYSCVNHVDLFVRSGAYATELPSPFIIGRDLSGTVQAVGSAVTRFKPGQRVWSNSMGYDGRQGAFAELCAVPEERLFPVPRRVADLRSLAGLSHGMTTAWLGLGRTAPVRPGQTVFIGGAAGAVGSAAVQLALSRGATVLASAALRDHEWIRSLGAAHVIDYAAADLAGTLRELCPHGVDLWWDTSGRQLLDSVLPLLAPRGTLLLTAGLNATASLPVGALYTRDASLRGFAVSNASAAELAQAAGALNTLLEAGEVAYRVDRELPLQDAALAHQLVEGGGLHGKVLVRIGGNQPGA